MAGKLLTRKAQIAVEVESAEGTAETLVDADATMLVYDPTFTPAVDRFKRNPARATLSQLAAVIGKTAGGISWRTELKGSGAVATQPAWRDALAACGFTGVAISTIAIGAVTSGPFIPGETVTGTSGGTGRVVGEVRTGTTPLPYVPISGTLKTSETLTGGTSGATTTSSGAPAATKGFEYRPISASIPSATVGLYRDGHRNIIAGARGNVRLEAQVGEPVFLVFDFQGVLGTPADVALLSPTYESTIPIAFKSVTGSVQTLAAIFAGCTIDLQNVIAARESANAAAGILSFLLTDRSPMATIDPEMELVATHDFYGKLISGATGRLYFELPSSSAGQKITVAAPLVQYSDVGQEDRSGIAVARLNLDLITAATGADDEIQIGMI